MSNYSREHSSFKRTNKCPLCRRKLMFPRVARPDGSRIKGFVLDKRVVVNCRHCGGSWPIFAPPVEQQSRAVDTIRVVETDRVQEAIGQDVRLIDNSGPAGSVRRVKATRRWAQRIEFAEDRANTINGGVNWVAFKVSAETTLHRHFGVSAETEQVFEEEIELSVPPRTVLELVLRWKRIWQQGLVVGAEADGRAVQVPFRAVVGLTFDQVTR